MPPWITYIFFVRCSNFPLQLGSFLSNFSFLLRATAFHLVISQFDLLFTVFSVVVPPASCCGHKTFAKCYITVSLMGLCVLVILSSIIIPICILMWTFWRAEFAVRELRCGFSVRLSVLGEKS